MTREKPDDKRRALALNWAKAFSQLGAGGGGGCPAGNQMVFFLFFCKSPFRGDLMLTTLDEGVLGGCSVDLGEYLCAKSSSWGKI